MIFNRRKIRIDGYTGMGSDYYSNWQPISVGNYYFFLFRIQILVILSGVKKVKNNREHCVSFIRFCYEKSFKGMTDCFYLWKQ